MQEQKFGFSNRNGTASSARESRTTGVYNLLHTPNPNQRCLTDEDVFAHEPRIILGKRKR